MVLLPRRMAGRVREHSREAFHGVKPNHLSQDLKLHDVAEELALGGLQIIWAKPTDKTRRHTFRYSPAEDDSVGDGLDW